MAQPVTVYRWDDPGAPQITNRKPSEIINVLKKCLVEGYGTKDPLGWTMPYEDAGNIKAAFKNSVAAGGSGGYVQVKSSNGSDTSNIALSMTPAKSMVDIDTLFHRGYIRPFSITTGWTNWVLIGTATAFYLIAANNGPIASWAGIREQVAFVGDFNSFIDNDVSRFIVSAANAVAGDLISTSYLNFTHSFISNTPGEGAPGQAYSSGNLLLYDTDGFDSNLIYSVAMTSGFSSSSSLQGSVDIAKKRNVFTNPTIVASGVGSNNVAAKDRSNVLLQLSDLSPRVRGTLPGSLIEICPRYTTESWPITEDINGQNHWLLSNPAGRLAYYWINMVEW
jgi:hypothetical protein